MGLHEDKYKAGREVMDSTPMAVPIGMKRPESLVDQMRSMIRRELSEAAAQHGRETFEEANDFEVDDDPDDPTTPWEHAADADDRMPGELDEARLAMAAKKAGWRPPPKTDPWQEWATSKGWTPPPSPSSRPSSQGPQAPQAPSAGANTRENPAPSPEASSHSPST